MTKWLVEEITQELAGNEVIAFHTVVEGDDARNAFWHAGFDRTGEYNFLFDPSELEEIDEGYRWAASDGSMICYEVRKLD